MYDFFNPGIDNSQITWLKSKVESLHSLVLEKYGQKAINCIGGNKFYSQESAFQGPFQQQGNAFSRNCGVSSYQAPPAPTAHESRIEIMIEQYLERQQQINVSHHSKMDALYKDLNEKLESLSTHMEELDAAIERRNEVREAEQHRSIKVVTLRDEIKLLDEEESIISDFLDEYCLPDTCTDRHPLSDDRPAVLTAISSSFEKQNRLASIDTHYATIDAERTHVQKPATVPERAYKPRVPYPKVPKPSKQELEVANCMKVIDKKVNKTPPVEASRVHAKKMISTNGHLKEEVQIGGTTVSDSGKKKMAVSLKPALTSSVPATAHKQKAPNIRSTSKVRNKSSKLKPPDHVVLNAGKRSRPLKLRSRPDSDFSFLGKPHDHNAYTPPWMKRYSQRHSKSLLKPP